MARSSVAREPVPSAIGHASAVTRGTAGDRKQTTIFVTPGCPEAGLRQTEKALVTVGKSDSLGRPWPRTHEESMSQDLQLQQERRSALELLARRRSVKAQDLQEPGPDDATLGAMLGVAMRVPDHGKLGPWRFLVVRGDRRADLGEIIARRFRELHPEADDEAVAFERGRFLRAPVVVAVVSSPNPKAVKIPLWEQQLSAGAACQNLLNAALFAGFGAQWLTEWYSYDEAVAREVGLAEGERFAGFVYLGSSTATPEERPRPSYESRVTEWSRP